MRISDWSSDVCSSDVSQEEPVLGVLAHRQSIDPLLACYRVRLRQFVHSVGQVTPGIRHAVELACTELPALDLLERHADRIGVAIEPLDRKSTRLNSSH